MGSIMDVSALTAGVPGVTVEWLGPEFPVLRLQCRQATARVALQGAQVLSYVPTGGRDLLWCSERALYQPGQAVRGGIPLCWPWFGPHPAQPTWPAHGLARTARWQLQSLQPDADGVELVLTLAPTAAIRALWPHDFRLSLRIHIGAALALELEMHNLAREPVPISHAFHSYFAVDAIEQVMVAGLDGLSYRDQLQGQARYVQRGPVRIAAEVDRLYLHGRGDCQLQEGDRRLAITAPSCASTVVWNPWQAKTARLADMAPDGYRRMLCVESGNVADDALVLRPGEVRCVGLRLASIERAIESQVVAGAPGCCSQ